MNNKAARAGTILMAVGLLLLVAAGLWVGYNIWDDYRAGRSSSEILDKFPTLDSDDKSENNEGDDSVSVPLYVTHPEMDMPTVQIDGNTYVGRIDIPSVGISLPVMSEWSYPNLKLSPCRYYGSAYQGNMIIAGHDYKSHFGALRSLSCGDTVIFTDMDGNVFTYEVSEIDQLASDDVEAMTEEGNWSLTLFTCTIGGNYRVTVRCKAV
jgi:sortase A